MRRLLPLATLLAVLLVYAAWPAPAAVAPAAPEPATSTPVEPTRAAVLPSLLLAAAPALSPTPTTPTATAAPVPALVLSATVTPTAIPTAVATARPATRPPAVPPAAGVTAVGDSVLLAAAEPLRAALPAVDVDAAAGRQVEAALAVLRARQAAGQLGAVVLVHIGNNGPLGAAQFDELMRLCAGARRVVVVNLKAPRDWEAGNNAVLAAGVRRYANAVLVDWRAASQDRPEWFWDDAIHLRPAGARAYADLVLPYLRQP